MTTTALDLVDAYHSAWTTGDLDRAAELVADDIRYQAPDVVLVGKEAWREYLSGFVPMLTAAVDIARFADDDRVVLLYHPQTEATKDVPAAEYFVVRDDRIAEVILMFDRLTYGPPSGD